MKHTAKALIGTSMVASVMLSSCASIFNRSEQPVQVSSMPSGLTFRVTDSEGKSLASGTTPGQATLSTSNGYFQSASYTFTFSKNGKVVGTQEVSSTVSGWYFGNILIGGLLGMVVIDPLTGSMYTLQDEVIHGGTPSTTVKQNTSGGITVLSLDQLTPGQRDRLIKL